MKARERIRGRAGKGLEASEGAERMTVASRAELQGDQARSGSRRTSGLGRIVLQLGAHVVAL